ncbi:hypothetical protein FPK33_24885, partial [Acinetobacter baumannii]|nr:hypothetical protein [Acinetobacter baumannii]
HHRCAAWLLPAGCGRQCGRPGRPRDRAVRASGAAPAHARRPAADGRRGLALRTGCSTVAAGRRRSRPHHAASAHGLVRCAPLPAR